MRYFVNPGVGKPHYPALCSLQLGLKPKNKLRLKAESHCEFFIPWAGYPRRSAWSEFWICRDPPFIGSHLTSFKCKLHCSWFKHPPTGSKIGCNGCFLLSRMDLFIFIHMAKFVLYTPKHPFGVFAQGFSYTLSEWPCTVYSVHETANAVSLKSNWIVEGLA